LAFFGGDLAIARSYRTVFAMEIFEAFFGGATFYYLTCFVSTTLRRHHRVEFIASSRTG
jgi:hypothetical protein